MSEELNEVQIEEQEVQTAPVEEMPEGECPNPPQDGERPPMPPHGGHPPMHPHGGRPTMPPKDGNCPPPPPPHGSRPPMPPQDGEKPPMPPEGCCPEVPEQEAPTEESQEA